MNITCPFCHTENVVSQGDTWPCPTCGRKWKDWIDSYQIMVTDELQFFSEPQDPSTSHEIYDHFQMMVYEGILETTYQYPDPPTPEELGYMEQAGQWPPELVAERVLYEWKSVFERFVSGQFINKRYDDPYWYGVAKCTLELHKFLCLMPLMDLPFLPMFGALPFPIMFFFLSLLNGAGKIWPKKKI